MVVEDHVLVLVLFAQLQDAVSFEVREGLAIVLAFAAQLLVGYHASNTAE